MNFTKKLNTNEFLREKQFSFDPRTLEEKLQNAKNINLKIKETYKKIKSSTEKYINLNSISNNSLKTNIDKNPSLNKNKNANANSNDRYNKNINKDKNSSLQLTKTNLNESIESYQGSFHEDMNNSDNPYAKLLNVREERIKILTERNNENDFKITDLKKQNRSLIKAIEDLVDKFNPPRNAHVLKNDSQ